MHLTSEAVGLNGNRCKTNNRFAPSAASYQPRAIISGRWYLLASASPCVFNQFTPFICCVNLARKADGGFFGEPIKSFFEGSVSKGDNLEQFSDLSLNFRTLFDKSHPLYHPTRATNRRA